MIINEFYLKCSQREDCNKYISVKRENNFSAKVSKAMDRFSEVFCHKKNILYVNTK